MYEWLGCDAGWCTSVTGDGGSGVAGVGSSMSSGRTSEVSAPTAARQLAAVKSSTIAEAAQAMRAPSVATKAIPPQASPANAEAAVRIQARRRLPPIPSEAFMGSLQARPALLALPPTYRVQRPAAGQSTQTGSTELDVPSTSSPPAQYR